MEDWKVLLASDVNWNLQVDRWIEIERIQINKSIKNLYGKEQNERQNNEEIKYFREQREIGKPDVNSKRNDNSCTSTYNIKSGSNSCIEEEL